MNFKYLILRLIRKFIPPCLVKFQLSKQVLIRPGMETRSPADAVDRYDKFLKKVNRRIKGSSILIFGYGGYLGTSIELLERGARQIYLYDKYAKPSHQKNKTLAGHQTKYFTRNNHNVIPNKAFLRIIDGDLNAFIRKNPDIKFDMILSGAVLEHVEDVDVQIQSLYQLTREGGIHLHIIDLRDHYFKYPFHMLCYEEKTWKKFLNPESNLNRLRYNDYKTIFLKYFKNLTIESIHRDDASFQKMRIKIRPEFLSGNDQIDAVTGIAVTASR